MLITQPLQGELTLHVVLGTIPSKEEKNFDKTIRREFYQRFREKFLSYCAESKKNPNKNRKSNKKKEEIEILYNPLRYFMLGNYDIAYIALINNFKFAQRLFDSAPSGKNYPFLPHTFQTFTGITHHKTNDLKDHFHNQLNTKNKARKYFLGICNLKLNNGFLIGNGNQFMMPVIIEIGKIIDNLNKNKSESDRVEFIIQQSFSWFELTLLLFVNKPGVIAEILTTLRQLTVDELGEEICSKIVEDSLYKELLREKQNSVVSQFEILY